MPYSSSWDIIEDTDSSQIILSVDFPAAKRPRASFTDLAGRIGSRYRFLQTRLPAVRDGQHLTADTYVSPWVEEIRHDRRRVLAVFGHCYGSVYAAAIAEGIAQWQQMPTIILFNPRVASTELLDREFHREISSIDSLLSDDEIERFGKIAMEISESAAGNVEGAAAQMIRAYREFSVAAFERAGLGGARGDRFINFFEACISCMSVADRIDPSGVWKRSTAIVSCDYLGYRNMSHPVNGASSLIGRRISVDVEDVDLLRSASAAQQVREILGVAHR